MESNQNMLLLIKNMGHAIQRWTLDHINVMLLRVSYTWKKQIPYYSTTLMQIAIKSTVPPSWYLNYILGHRLEKWATSSFLLFRNCHMSLKREDIISTCNSEKQIWEFNRFNKIWSHSYLEKIRKLCYATQWDTQSHCERCRMHLM